MKYGQLEGILKPASKLVYGSNAIMYGDDSEAAAEVMDIAFENPELLTSYDAVKNDDADYALRQSEILKSLGIDDITKIFSSLLGASAHIANPTEAAERISTIAKRTLTQN